MKCDHFMALGLGQYVDSGVDACLLEDPTNYYGHDDQWEDASVGSVAILAQLASSCCSNQIHFCHPDAQDVAEAAALTDSDAAAAALADSDDGGGGNGAVIAVIVVLSLLGAAGAG